MTQVTAGGRRREGAGWSGESRAIRDAGSVEAALAKPERYLNRHAPGIFAKWWDGWVSIAPGLLCSNLK